MSQIIKGINKNILLIIFLVEILSNLLRYFGYDVIRISLLVKAFILAFFLNNIYKKKWLFFAVLFLVFLISFLTIDIQFLSKDTLERIFSFSKYMFFPISFFYFKELLLDDSFHTSLKKQFEMIFFISYFLIFTGYFFEIDFLRTYKGNRFGYNGIFVSQNEASYILLSSFFYFFWITKNNVSSSNIFKSALSIIALSLVGTKTIYFSLLFFFGGYLVYKRNLKTSILTFLSILIITFLVTKNSVVTPFYNLYLEKGFWYSLTSFRSDYINTRFFYQIQNHWEPANYLFGGPFLSCYKLIEMEMLDLFIFFGFIGSIIYFYTIYKACASFFYNKFTYFIGFILLVASFFTGHFFLSGSVGIYLASLMYLIKKNRDTLLYNNALIKIQNEVIKKLY